MISCHPRISVVIPFYNAADYIGRFCNSIEQQQYSDVEYIFVDDGSTDNGRELLEERLDAMKNVTIIVKANGGASSARNEGLRNCVGDYVTFWDIDDEQSGDMLCILAEEARGGADVICTGLVRRIEGRQDESMFVRDAPAEVSASEALGEWLGSKSISTGPYTKLVSRGLIEREGIRFTEGEINEDVMYTYEILSRASSVRITGLPLYVYRQNQGSVTSAPFDERFLVVFKNCDLLQERIMGEYPELLSACREYCAKGIWGVCRRAARRDSRIRFPRVYEECMRRLEENLPYIRTVLRKPKDKIELALVRLGLYALVR